MKSFLWFIFIAITLHFSLPVSAELFVTDEPEDGAYRVVEHYQVEINASESKVWTHLIDLGAWMDEFEMSPVSGSVGQMNQVFRLYPGQNFYIQITGMIPNKLLTIANLPAEFNGELSLGAGIIQLAASQQHTIVSVTLSRRFTKQGSNPMKEKRQSKEFREISETRWQKFLLNLRELSEKSAIEKPPTH